MQKVERKLEEEIKQLMQVAESVKPAEVAKHGKGAKGLDLLKDLEIREKGLKKICEVRGSRQFSLGGFENVYGEWQLKCIDMAYPLKEVKAVT